VVDGRRDKDDRKQNTLAPLAGIVCSIRKMQNGWQDSEFFWGAVEGWGGVEDCVLTLHMYCSVE
jgi:hypothetical protein